MQIFDIENSSDSLFIKIYRLNYKPSTDLIDLAESLSDVLNSSYKMILFCEPYSHSPTYSSLYRAYSHLSRFQRKNCQELIIVHSSFIPKFIYNSFKAVISSKFLVKINFIDHLSDLKVPLNIHIDVLQHDNSISPVFGANINYLVETPLFLISCFELIKQETKTVGLFRVSPQLSVLKSTIQKINAHTEFLINDVHIASSLIKHFYKDLKPPFFAKQDYNMLNITDFNSAQSLLNTFSTSKRRIFLSTCKILKLVADAGIGMDISNLVIVFAPNLVNSDDVILDFKLSSGIGSVGLFLKFCIENADVVF